MKRATDVLVAGSDWLSYPRCYWIIGVAIRMIKPRPLFIQDRVGRGGDVYRLVKFRTMYEGAEESREDVLGSLAGDPDSYRTDPRITPLGHCGAGPWMNFHSCGTSSWGP